MSFFKEDRIENEKNDPSEKSSLKYINIPLVLIAFFLGFGVNYIAMKTDSVSMKEGDSRTEIQVASKEKVANKTDTTDLRKTLEKGKQIFASTCQACHQANGSGLPGTFPPLAHSTWVTGSSERLVAIILHGLQGEITVNEEKFNSFMPAFKAQLKPEDVAQVATYIRQSFGNQAEPVSIETVEKTLAKTASQVAPWNGEVELNKQNWNN